MDSLLLPFFVTLAVGRIHPPSIQAATYLLLLSCKRVSHDYLSMCIFSPLEHNKDAAWRTVAVDVWPTGPHLCSYCVSCELRCRQEPLPKPAGGLSVSQSCLWLSSNHHASIYLNATHGWMDVYLWGNCFWLHFTFLWYSLFLHRYDYCRFLFLLFRFLFSKMLQIWNWKWGSLKHLNGLSFSIF